MRLTTENIDLFELPYDYYILHQISAKCNFKKGLAKKLNQVFNIKNNSLLTSFDHCVGEAVLTGNVFNLIVTEEYFRTPEYENIYSALEAVKDIIDLKAKGGVIIKNLAMPKICSSYGLDWNKILGMLEEIFCETEVNIMICTKEEEENDKASETGFESCSV